MELVPGWKVLVPGCKSISAGVRCESISAGVRRVLVPGYEDISAGRGTRVLVPG